MNTRREFIHGATLSAASFGLLPRGFAAEPGLAHDGEIASFFVVGDTHYCADEKQPDRMLPHSLAMNRRLVGWLNRLPGTDLPGPLGAGKLPVPHGVIHAGDLVENGAMGEGDDKAYEFGRRETFYATFTADAVRLAQQHYQMFGETLDINQILQHPKLGELRMDGAYQDLFKDQLAARNAKIEAEKLQKLEAEIRAKVVSELRQNPAGGGLPYPVGSAPSPLDHLTPQGQTPQAFDPNAVAAAYEQLVASKA